MKKDNKIILIAAIILFAAVLASNLLDTITGRLSVEQGLLLGAAATGNKNACDDLGKIYSDNPGVLPQSVQSACGLGLKVQQRLEQENNILQNLPTLTTDEINIEQMNFESSLRDTGNFITKTEEDQESLRTREQETSSLVGSIQEEINGIDHEIQTKEKEISDKQNELSKTQKTIQYCSLWRRWFRMRVSCRNVPNPKIGEIEKEISALKTEKENKITLGDIKLTEKNTKENILLDYQKEIELSNELKINLENRKEDLNVFKNTINRELERKSESERIAEKKEAEQGFPKREELIEPNNDLEKIYEIINALEEYKKFLDPRIASVESDTNLEDKEKEFEKLLLNEEKKILEEEIKDLRKKIEVSNLEINKEDVAPEPIIYLPDKLTLSPNKNLGFTIADLSRNYDIKDAELFLKADGKEDLKLSTRINRLDLETVGVSDVLWEVVYDYWKIKDMGFGKYNFVLILTDNSNKEARKELPIELFMDKDSPENPEGDKTAQPEVEPPEVDEEEYVKTEERVKEEPKEEPPIEDEPPKVFDEDEFGGCSMELRLTGYLDDNLGYGGETYGSPSPTIPGPHTKLGKSEGKINFGPYKKGFYRVGWNFEIHARADPKTYKEGQWVRGTYTYTNFLGNSGTRHAGKEDSNAWDGDEDTGYKGTKMGNDDYQNEVDYASNIQEEWYKQYKVKEHKPGVIHWYDIPGLWFEARLKHAKVDGSFKSIVWKEEGGKIVDYCACYYDQHIEVENKNYIPFLEPDLNIIKNEIIPTGGIKCKVVLNSGQEDESVITHIPAVWPQES